MASFFAVRMKATGLASYVEPYTKFEALIVPNDANWTAQWGPKKIEADWAWNYTTGRGDVFVAVVDTGIDWNHSDLAANYIPIGYDWVNNDTDPMDDHGHGTHVSGIIAAVLNNSIGIAGLSQVQVMAEKGLNDEGKGYPDWLFNAIIHAVDQGADIISMSWGSYSPSSLIYEAIKYASDAGVLLVAAAGNDATDLKMYPAGYDEVIAVAAIDQYDDPTRWSYERGSNLGDWIELAAPGNEIYSTLISNTYGSKSGTSMAAPHVSGVAALVWSRYPHLNKDSVRYWLRSSADDLGLTGFDMYYGYGRINAHTAVKTGVSAYDLVALGLDVPPVVEVNKSRVVEGTILNLGNENQTNVEVYLSANGTVVGNTTISYLPSGNSSVINFSWTPTAGVYNLTLNVEPEDPTFEYNRENNFKGKNVTARFPTILNVPSDYPGIQAALHEALPKDTINVSAGTYDEIIVIDKADVKLIGEARELTTIQGRGWSPVINVKANNVTATGFSIRGKVVYPPFEPFIGGNRYGIEINGFSGVNISLNNVEEALWGIGTSSSNNSVIQGNYIEKNEFGGILGDNLNTSVISDNTVTEHKRPINYQYPHFKYGLALTESYGNYITDNNVISNYMGVSLTSFHGNVISYNNISNNQVGGINLEGNNNTFNGNAVINNAWQPESSPLPEPDLFGIFLSYAHSNTMRNNTIVDNGFNFIVVGDSLEHFVQDIDASNTVDGRPIYYWVNRQNEQVPLNAGYVALVNSSNITATGLTLKNNYEGILLAYTLNSSITDNNMTSNKHGIRLVNSSNNILARNNITANEAFNIYLYGSSNNEIFYNTVNQSLWGLWTDKSSSNKIFHNGFFNNINHAYNYESANVWDNGYPSGGNYWDDYTGVDQYSGPYQNENGSDGIGDTPYTIDADNQDRYPLIEELSHDLKHDIAITDLGASKTTVSPGETVQISVVVQNQGNFNETFTLSVYVVGGETIWGPTTITLSPSETSTQTFQWTAPTTTGNYVIRAEASTVPGEIDTPNNTREITITVSVGGGGGGCPYVSAWNGSNYVVDNNLIPAAEYSNGTDVTDYYLLQQPLVQDDGKYSLLIWDLDKHSFLDRVQLMAVDHESDVKVAVSPDGEILTYRDATPTVKAFNKAGENVSDLLEASDGQSYQGYEGDYIQLDFDGADIQDGAKLVIRSDVICDPMPCLKSPVYIQTLNSTGAWQTISTIYTRLYWATDIIDLSQHLPDANGELKVRISFTSNDKIDFIGLDTSKQGEFETHHASLASAVHSNGTDMKEALKQSDNLYAELLPGEQVTLKFTLPQNKQDIRDFIIIVEGHYFKITP